MLAVGYNETQNMLWDFYFYRKVVMGLKQEFEEKFCYAKKVGSVSYELLSTEKLWSWIASKINEAKEEGFNAGCDYTCKQYGECKTESEIRLEELDWILSKDKKSSVFLSIRKTDVLDRKNNILIDFNLTKLKESEK